MTHTAFTSGPSAVSFTMTNSCSWWRDWGWAVVSAMMESYMTWDRLGAFQTAYGLGLSVFCSDAGSQKRENGCVWIIESSGMLRVADRWEERRREEDVDSCPSMLQTYFRAICAGVVPSGEEHQIQGDIWGIYKMKDSFFVLNPLDWWTVCPCLAWLNISLTSCIWFHLIYIRHPYYCYTITPKCYVDIVYALYSRYSFFPLYVVTLVNLVNLHPP